MGYRVLPRLDLRLMAAHHPLPGSDWNNVEPVGQLGGEPNGPDGIFTYVLLGAAVPFTHPEASGWSVRALAGVGAAHMELDPTLNSPGGSFWRRAFGGGAELAYPFGGGVSLVGRSLGLVFLRAGDGSMTGGRFGKELTFSYTAGLRVTF